MKQIKATTISGASEHLVELMCDAIQEGRCDMPAEGVFSFPWMDVQLNIEYPSECCNTYFTHDVISNFINALKSPQEPQNELLNVDFYRWATETFPANVYWGMRHRKHPDICLAFRIINPMITSNALQLIQWDDGWAANRATWQFAGPLHSDYLMALEGAIGMQLPYARKLVAPLAQAAEALTEEKLDVAEEAVLCTPVKIDWAMAARKYIEILKEEQRNANTHSKKG